MIDEFNEWFDNSGYDELVYLISDIVDQIKIKALKESE